MSILKFLPIFIGGMLLCGCESGTVMTEPEIETLDQEISRVENEDVVSMTDKDNCFLCGSNRPGFLIIIKGWMHCAGLPEYMEYCRHQCI